MICKIDFNKAGNKDKMKQNKTTAKPHPGSCNSLSRFFPAATARG
jgi:hypothetical protein